MACFDLVTHLKLTSYDIKLPHQLWCKINPKIKDLVDNAVWKDFKYIVNNELNHEIKNVANVRGGIYCFYIDPEIIPKAQRVLIYIGRAQITDNQNLRKRISEYFGYIQNNDKDIRPKVEQFFSEYKDYLYCKYMELDDNDLITETEAELINKLLPLANSSIPDVYISDAVKRAF